MPNSNKFLKPHIPRPGLLEPKPGNPLGYVTNDGKWAAVPLGNSKKFAIIHNVLIIKNVTMNSCGFVKTC